MAEQRERRALGQRKADDDQVRRLPGAEIHRFALAIDPVNLPGRVLQAFGDLLDDGGLVLDDQNVGGILGGPLAVAAFGDGLQIDDSAGLFDQHVFLEGLDDVVAHAELGDLHHVVAAALGGQHDHRDGL